MKSITTYKVLSKAHIACRMMNESGTGVVSLLLKHGKDLSNGHQINLPEITNGSVLFTRRKLFRFWEKESLVEQESEVGTFFLWVDEADLLPRK